MTLILGLSPAPILALADAGPLAGLSKYASQPHRRRASSPKLNVFNTALTTAGSGYSFDQAKAGRTFWGHLVESAVGAHLLNTKTSDIRLHYWRDSPHEVDFVLHSGLQTVAIEVKSGPKPASLRGMLAFEQHFDPCRLLLVGEGGTPLDEFLTVPARRWFE